MKPILIGDSGVDNLFKDRPEKVSISFDTTRCAAAADVKVFVQLEPPIIKDIRLELLENSPQFDIILAWHPQILERLPRAQKFVYGTTWIDLDTFKSDKQNEISFLMSNKNITMGHSIRHHLYKGLHQLSHIYDFSFVCLKTPPRIPKKDVIFEKAKFSIIIENDKIPNLITEKLIDCLVTRTVPIYWGAPNVGEFFDERGIISFDTIENFIKILDTLTPQLYDSLEDVIEKNYQLSFKYHDFHGRIDDIIDTYIETNGPFISD